MSLFALINKKKKKITLHEKEYIDKESSGEGIAYIYYDIMYGDKKVGAADLRIGMNEELYYYGNVGYRIFGLYRGHGYAYEACLLLMDEARKEGMEELVITCSPENQASYKTNLRLKGKLEAIVDVPEDHELYKRKERRKCIFRYKL